MMTRDPACGMNLDEDKAAATSQHAGRTYYFCSLACKATFEEAPDKCLQRLAAAGFVAEAVLAADLVESTRPATHYGDVFLDEDAAEGLAFPLRMVGFIKLKGVAGAGNAGPDRDA